MASVERTPGILTIAQKTLADVLLNIAKNPQNVGTDLVTIGDAVHARPRK